MNKKLYAIDLFCGAGGLTHGLKQEGVKVLAGIDCDSDCQFPYEYNNGCQFLHRWVEQLDLEELRRLYPKRGLRLLAGCAPCQPFSTYTQGREATNDPKWPLLHYFGEIAVALQPDFITMENVSELANHSVFSAFVQRLRKAGYAVSFYPTVKCVEYGIPQERERLVLFASLHGTIELIPPTHQSGNYVTVCTAIGAMPAILAGQIHSDDPLHRASRLSSTNLKRIRASKPGGTWRDWPAALRAECHRKASGKSYPSVYGRMEWGKPAPTITTQSYGFGNGRFGHPEQDRAISLREAALLQSFPIDYAFVPPEASVRMKIVGKMIGNAVPVLLGRVVGRSILQHVAKI